ncbi:MAG TPA: helix-hairpin-helix domain-containing protein [Candidatus Goldiibacteriota bacterium]|nr:helix-hairpin-helix domain-containing protein [Candidatus Goldiibacteriota bacterium]
MILTREEKTILLIILTSLILGCVIYFFTSFKEKIKVENKAEGQINLNTASMEEIDKLPGIGKTISLRIIEYREKNNGFKNTEELKKIKGITEKKFEKIRKYVKTE